MNSEPLNDVVIVGRDAALWLTACVLRTALQSSGVRVTAIELPTQLHEVDVYAALPPLEALHRLLRIDESALLGTIHGTFTLGQNFCETFFHAYGSYGSLVDGKAFFPHWLRARSLGLKVALEDFSLTACAAKHGRMLIPDAATEAYGRTDYGYHLPALEYVSALKQLARSRGVLVHQTKTIHCTLDPSTGAIAALTLDGHRKICGQLFVDATGPEALLIGSALGVQRESWRAYSRVDRIQVAAAGVFPSIPPYGEIRCTEHSWFALHPTRARTQLTLAYASAPGSESEAEQLAASVSGLVPRWALTRTCDPGMRALAWDRNCVAIGAAACAFDPLHSVDLHSVQLGLVHLLSLFPVTSDYSAERAEFNRMCRLAFERLRDFQTAHYALSRTPDCRLSPELAHKIETFRARGEVPLYEHETFALDNWQALFVGHGVIPESYDPMADRTPPETLKAELKRILRFIKDKVLEQTTHDFYLQNVCSAARPGDQRAAGARR